MGDSARPAHHEEDSFRTSDGLHLFAQCWRPDVPTAGVVIVHGYAEHSGRYAAVASHLTRNGHLVCAFDLRGHGRSQGGRCFVGAFHEYLADLKLFLLRVRSKCPGMQIFLLAHSMGGLIATLFVIRENPELAGMILSAPSLRLGSGFSIFKRKAAVVLGRLFPRLPTVRLQSAHLCRDTEVVNAYRADELVYHGRTPARTASEIIHAMEEVQARMEEIDLPVLIMHGSDDHLTDIEGSRELHARARSGDKMLKVYNGFYHEIMNEPEKADVLEDLSSWLIARTRHG